MLYVNPGEVPLYSTVINEINESTDPNYFEDPLLYKPERWLHDEDSVGINPFLVKGFDF